MQKIKNFFTNSYWLIAVGLMFVVMFNWISINECKDVAKLHNSKDTQIEIEATITSSDKYTETDEGFESDYYHANVSYTYNGKTYSGVYYDTTYTEPEIGKVVKVKIDPANPGELLVDNAELLSIAIMIPIFLAGITFVTYFCAKAATAYLLTKSNKTNESIPQIVGFIFVGCKIFFEGLLFYKKYNSGIFAIFSLVAVLIIAFIWLMLRRKKIKKENIPEENNISAKTV